MHIPAAPLLPIGLAAILALSGCSDKTGNGTDGVNTPNNDGGPGSIEITAPLQGEIVLTRTATVEGRASNLSQVRINGQTAPVQGGAFSLGIALPEGDQTIVVEADNAETRSVDVQVDLTPPKIQIDTPDRGQFIVLGQDDRLLIRGQVSDAGLGVKALTLNGQPVDLRGDGSFEVVTAPQIGLNVMELVATDRAERKSQTTRGAIYGEFTPFDRPSSDAIEARVDTSAFAVIEEAMIDLLQGDTLNELLTANLPPSDSFRILGVEVERAAIDLIPLDGRLQVRADLFGLALRVQIGNGAQGTISANPAEVQADVYVTLTESGSIQARTQGVEVNLRAFDVDFGEELDQGVVDALEVILRSVAENGMTALLEQFVVGDLFDPSLFDQEITLLGITLPFDIQLNTITISTNGIDLKGDVDIDVPAAPGALPSPGVLRTPSAPPAGRPSRMVRLSVADDMLNKMFAQAWRGGILNLEVRELLGEDGVLPIDLNVVALSLLVGNELKEHAPSDTPVDVNLRPLLPPVVTPLAEADRQMRVQFADLLLDLAFAPEGGQPSRWATVAIVLTLDVGVRLDENGELSLDFDIDVSADVEDEPLFDLDDEKVETVVQSLFESLPAILGRDGLSGLFDLGSVSILGIGLDEVAAHADGPSGDYISIDADLIATPADP